MSQPTRIRTLAAVFAAGMSLAACGDQQQQQQRAAMPPPEVEVIEVAARDLPLTYEYAGRITGSREVEVRARVGGILLERTYVEGQAVKQGDVLFRIDPEPYRVQLARAEAHYRQEEARLLQADRNWKRIAPLYERDTVSERQRDEALSALDLAKAGVAVAQAEVNAAKISLGYTEVRAPVSGVTSTEAVSEGSLVGTGANESLLTRITQLDPLYVNFAIPDSEWTTLQVAIAEGRIQTESARLMPIEVRLTSGGPVQLVGQLDFTESSVDPATGTIRARAVVPNPEGRLLPGQFVRVTLRGLTLKDGIGVPQKAVMQGPQGAFVYVLAEKDGQVQAQVRPIRLGQAVNDAWVVSRGLASGDRVVTEGIMKVRPGQPVRAASGQAQAGQPR